MAVRLKKSQVIFKLAKSFTPLYTGGAIALSSDATRLYTTLNDQVVLTDVETGERLHLFTGDTSTVTTIAVSPENASSAGSLLVAHRSLALRIYSAHDFSLSRTIARAHDAPITISAADPTGSLFATGSADGIVKVWDAVNGHCTHVFRGHGGVVSALYFDVDSSRSPRLVSASDDCRVRLWDLSTRKSLAVLEGHSSVVRGLTVTQDGKHLISGGRDQCFALWEIATGRILHTIPVYETLEAVGLVKTAQSGKQQDKGKGKRREERPAVEEMLWTAGDSGRVRLWNIMTGQEVELSHILSGKPHEIVQACMVGDTLVTAHVNQNLVFHHLPDMKTFRHIVGYNDEVIDTLFLASSSGDISDLVETHLAVATNSDLIRLYEIDAFNTTLLAGHLDVVLCLARSKDGSVLLSGSKDRSARIWKKSTAEGIWKCVGVCEGHVESVGAVAMAPRNGQFMVTASQDRTVKIWDAETFDFDAMREEPEKVKSLTTLKVHEKDINAVDISPNDRLLVTASQDRSAKLFMVEYTASSKASPQPTAKLNPLGIFKGHKRGVWSVKFSPAEQTLATASGDRTIKLWNINDFTCLKTFEGHTNTILRIDFLPTGAQLASCASDGLVKIWNIKDEECVATLDNHEEKIWALSANKDASMLVSGGADSVISFWQDVTEQEEEEEAAAQEDAILKQQDLANYMDVKDYRNAIVLALSMNQPRRLFLLLSDILADSATLDNTSIPILAEVLSNLGPHDVFRLLEYIRDWNAKSRDSDVAQTVLHTLLRSQSAATILKAVPGASGLEVDASAGSGATATSINEILEALLPYTERHYARADRLEQESAFLDFVLAQMDEFVGIEDTPIAGR